jgi:hypothetical protein
MASLEELIYTAVTGITGLQEKLASYKGMPAFFEGLAPDDTDQGWTGKQYPRAHYVIDRAEDPERKVSGMAFVEIWTTNDLAIGPEDIEADMRALLDGAVFHPGSEPVTALKWNRSEPWNQDSRLKWS